MAASQLEWQPKAKQRIMSIAKFEPDDPAIVGEANSTLPGRSCWRAYACRLLMRRDLGLEDLKDVHPEIYNSLKRLLVHEGNVAEMGLYFQVLSSLKQRSLLSKNLLCACGPLRIVIHSTPVSAAALTLLPRGILCAMLLAGNCAGEAL